MSKETPALAGVEGLVRQLELDTPEYAAWLRVSLTLRELATHVSVLPR